MHEIVYSAPTSVAEALHLLADRATPAKVLAGGTDLIIQMRAGLRRPARLVDVKRIGELSRLACDRSAGLSLGAAVPCWQLTADALVRDLYPGLVEAASLVGSAQIQSRATIAGNLCNGSPAADTAPALIALDATCVIAGVGGRREIPVAELILGPGRTSLGADEILVEVRVPAPGAGAADCYRRFIPRNEMDIAVVGVGVSLSLEGRVCRAARIALGAVAPTPLLALEAARSLVGTEIDAPALDRAAEAAVAAADPISDMRAPAAYRREMVAVLVRRVAREAARRAAARTAGSRES